MDLFTLGQQYLFRADELLGRIHVLNEKLSALDGKEAVLMRRRIISLYTDAAECRRKAKHLMNYNEKETGYDKNDI